MVMSPSIKNAAPVGIRRLEAGVAGASDDGERGGRVEEAAGRGARDLGVREGGAAADVVDDDAVGAGRVDADVVERRANDDLASVGSEDGDRDGQIGCGTQPGQGGRDERDGRLRRRPGKTAVEDAGPDTVPGFRAGRSSYTQLWW